MDTITESLPYKNKKKYGRNQKVQITDGLQTRVVKHKKAEPLFAQGWTLANAERNSRITWDGWKSFGSVNYTKITAIRELCNNALVDKSFGRKVNIQIVVDSITKTLYISDNMSGFVQHKMMDTMDIGASVETPAILREHGSGMKSAINFFGNLIYIRSTNDGADFVDLVPNLESDYASHLVYKSDDDIKIYNVKETKWENQLTAGSTIKIQLDDDQLPGNKGWFNNLKRGLEKSYHNHLGADGTMSIELVWLKDNELVDSWNCVKHNILLSSAKVVADEKIDPNTGKIYKYIGSKKKLGPDVWDLDELYKCPKTGIIVDLKIGRVPHPKNVEAYFNETFPGNQKYNPETFNNSVFTYGADTMGLSYCKKGIPISFGNFKATSRSSATLGFIDIIQGISTVKTKDNIKRTTKVEIFEEELEKYLKKHSIRVRAQDKYLNMSEKTMEDNLVKKMRRSKKVRNYLGYDGLDFNQQWSLHSGIPDVVCLETNKVVNSLIEVKKEGNERLWKALFQGVSYGYDSGTKKVLIVAQDDELPSDMQIKVDSLIQNGWEIRYEQYQRLMDM